MKIITTVKHVRRLSISLVGPRRRFIILKKTAPTIFVAGFLALCPLAPAGAQENQSASQPARLAAEDAGSSTSSSSSKTELPEAPNKSPKNDRRMTLGERLHIYEHSITNFDSILGPAFGAAVNQAKNEPPEWGQGAQGFGDRFASGYGRMLIGRTIRFGVAAMDHEDPRFHYSNESGFSRRARYATIHYFFVHTDAGTPIPAFSRFAGAYGASFIANEWYPESRANTSHALLRGTTAISSGLAWNVFREFWPDIKNAMHRHKD